MTSSDVSTNAVFAAFAIGFLQVACGYEKTGLFNTGAIQFGNQLDCPFIRCEKTTFVAGYVIETEGYSLLICHNWCHQPNK
jgi:hypothetical protein